jgi:GPH family glycoside/pentoside/hexuronide:cation symporter
VNKPLSRWTKLLYGSGDLGFSLTSTIIGAFFAMFLTDVVGVAPRIAAAAIFIGRTWDYINDPIFGHLTDRTRTRWGRRRPYLLFGVIPFALVFSLMWYRPPFQTQLALAVYYAFIYVLYDAAATMVYMPYFALTPELTSDYDERTSLTSIRAFFSIVGSLIAFTIPLMIVGGFSPEHAPNALRMGIIFAVISALPLLLVFFGIRERQEFMQQKQPSIRQSLRSSWRNKPFIFGLIIFLFTWVSVDILQAILLYFIKYVMLMESRSDLIMATIFIVAMLALPAWNWASRRWNKRKAYIVGIAFWAVVQLGLGSLASSTPFYLILFLCVLAGIGVSAAHVLPWSMIPDAIEWGEWHTGERHEGMFYSLITLAQKIASSTAVPLALLVLDATGYQPNTSIQSASAIQGIRLVTGPIPAVLLCLGILFALLYPLGRERYTQINAELSARRSAPKEPGV